MFQSLQQKFRQRLADVLIAGAFHLETKTGVVARITNGQRNVMAGNAVADVIRLVRVGANSYQLNLFPDQSDRGLTFTFSNATSTITANGNTLTLAGQTVVVPATIVFPGASTCQIGPPLNSANGTVTFGASATAPVADVATGVTELRAQTARTTATTNIAGGTVLICAGNGASASAGNAHGGNVRVCGGTGYGTGTGGQVQLGYDGTGTSRVTVRNTILGLNGFTSSAADPTTTEIATDGDFGVHKNTASGTVFLAFNDGGTIKKVALA